MSARRYFGTDGIRGKANEPPLTAEFAQRLGQAAAETFLRRAGEPPAEALPSRQRPVVVIGRDTRESGPMLESAVAAGITSCGVDVLLAGVIPTPAVSMLARDESALFGVVVSASHNPWQDNGIKFFGGDGYKLDDAFEIEIEAALDGEAAHGGALRTEDALGGIRPLEDAADRYVDFVSGGTDSSAGTLDGLRIALDAANGAAYRTSAAALARLGAEVLVFHDAPDGRNINAGCGCTHPETISQLVRENGADLGVSHDGDADRVLLCDERGEILDGDELMAIAAVGMLAEGRLANRTLVATVMSNGGLDEAVRRAGGSVLRVGVGDRYVLEAMRREGCNLGGEQSGHFIFMDRNRTGDGIVAAIEFLRLLKAKGVPLSELRKTMEKLPQAQRQVRVLEKPPFEELQVAAEAETVRRELGDSGRVLVRYSGTEALLRVLVEGRDPDLVAACADRLAAAVRSEIGLEEGAA